MAEQVYSVTVSYTLGGQFCQNVFKYAFDDAGFADTATAALALLNRFQADKVPKILSILSNQVTMNSLKGRGLTGGGGFEAVTFLPAGTVGTRSGQVQVSGVGPVTLWGTAANAKCRGKTFWPGVNNTDCIDGTFTSAFVTAHATAMGLFITDMILTGGGGPTAKFIIRQTKPVVTNQPVAWAQLVRIPGTLRKRQRPA